MKKRVLSVLLALCMALTLLPTAAWAAEDPVAILAWIEEGQAKTVDLDASDLPGCCLQLWNWDSSPEAARTDAATLTLLKDVRLEEPLRLGYADIALDGQGATLSRGFGGSFDGAPPVMCDDGNHRLVNVTLDGTYCGEEEPTSPPTVVDVWDGASITLGSGTSIVNGGQPPAAEPDCYIPAKGGAIDLASGGALRLEDGASITGNRGQEAGGVYAEVGSRVEFPAQTARGGGESVTIQNNTVNGRPSNLVLLTTEKRGADDSNFVPIQVSRSLAGSSIGVSRLAWSSADYKFVTAPGVVAVGANGYTLDQDDLAAFFSDDPLYAPSLDVVNNAIVLGDLPPHVHAMSVGCETTGGDQLTYQPLTVNGAGKLCVDGVALTADRYGDYTLGGGNYYLAGDIVLDSNLGIIDPNNAPTNLCLNGHTLDLGEGRVVIRYTGSGKGVLNLCNCGAEGKVTSAYSSDFSPSAATIEGNHQFSLYGGTVENTAASSDAYKNAVGHIGATSLYGGKLVCLNGNGLYLYGGREDGVTLSGDVTIQGGTGQADIFSYPGGHAPLILAGPLTKPATPWRVAVKNGTPMSLVTGWDTQGEADFTDYFQSASKGLFLTQLENKDLALDICAITQQPSTENNYTVAANGAPVSAPAYQWYPATMVTVDITPENAAIYGEEYRDGCYEPSNFADGKWTASEGTEIHEPGYFTLALKRGDQVAVTLATNDLPDGGQLGLVRDFYEPGEYVQVWYPFDGDTEGYSHVGTAAEDGDNTVITYVIPADGTYDLRIDGMYGSDQSAPPISAALTGAQPGAALTGQTDPKLNTTDLGGGLYLCRVTWPDGTALSSDTVAYTPPACDHTWGKWTLDDDGETLTRVCGKDASHVETDTLLCALPSAPIFYDGTAKAPAVSAKTPGAGALEEGTHYTVTYQNNVNVGTATVTVTGKGDYDFTLERTFTIGKGKVKTQDLQPGSLNIANGLANEYAYTLTLLCPAVGGSWGERTYAIESVVFDRAGYYVDGTARIDKLPGGTYANRLFLPISRNDTDFEGVVGTVTIRFSSDNYEDYTNTIAIRATNKAAVTFEGVTTPDKTYDGTAYAFEGTLVTRDKKSGYVVNADVEILYTGRNATAYSPADPHAPPTDVGEYAMTIRVVDTDPNYIGRDPNYNFVIRQAPGEGAVTMSGYAEGETPSAPIATSATNGVEGVSFRYKAKGAADSAYGTQPPTAAGEYTVQATFPATRNYAAVTATADFTVTKSAVTPPQGETKGEVEVKPGTPAVSVDQEALKDLAGTVEQGQTVTVTLTVEKLAAPAADEKAELEGIMTGEKGDVLYLDLSLVKQINDQTPERITDTGDKVLEIAVPYDFEGKKDVTVYRKHADRAAEALTALSARPAGDFADGTFFADNQGGVVYIYTGKFSTYAIGYTAVEEEPAPTPSRRPSRRPSREEVTPLPFVDVATTDPFYDAVRYVYENKLMVGTSETTFAPEGDLSRAMLAVILYRAAGSPKVEGAPEFTDTLAGAWYSDAVVWASQTRVLRGYGNGQFGPHDPVSKEMMNLVTARQAGQDPAWVGDPALAVPATRAEMAQALMGQKK